MIGVQDPLQLQVASYDEPDVVRLTAEVQDHYRQLYGGGDDAPLTTAELAPPSGLFLLGRLGGEPVAMGGWRFTGDLQAPGAQRTVELRRMYVSPPVRRHGLARTLLAELERTAAAAGSDAVVLATGRRQTAAVRLYRACGYVEVPGFGHYADMPGAIQLGKILARGKD